jgi:tetratricopeptide (TPR) repeat protein
MVEERDIITVDPMDRGHARTLFEAKLGIPDKTEDIMELTAALEYMPLAIVQAASYIRQRAPRSSVRKYLQQLESSDYRKLNLLEHEEGQFRRDWEARNSIIRTWQISFDHILQERPSAANLLALMSFFDRQGIHECLLQDLSQTESSNNDQEKHSEAVDNRKMDSANSLGQSDVDDSFEDDISILRNFSFITVNADAVSFQMHRLVQLAMQKWLEAHGQLERWKLSFIRSLAREFPSWDSGNWEKCQMLFPHIKLAMFHQPDTEDSLAMLLHSAASYAMITRHMNEAEEMAVTALKLRQSLFGPESVEALNSIKLLGLVMDDQGKYDEAIVLHQQAAAGFEQLLGASHPCTLESLSNLGLTLTCLGKYGEAEIMLRKALAGSEKILGVDHYNTLLCMGNLGAVLAAQGKYAEAELLHRQALSGTDRRWVDDCLHTLTKMNILAASLKEQKGDVYGKTRRHRRALPSFANMSKVGYRGQEVSRDQGEYQDAEDFCRKMLISYRQRLRPDHPMIFTAMNNLGVVLLWQEKFQEAEVLFQQALTSCHGVLNDDHPDNLTRLSNLASALAGQGKYKDAEVMQRRALAGREKMLGSDHPHTLLSMKHLAYNLWIQDREGEAIELLQCVVRLQCQSLGPKHPQTIDSMTVLHDYQVFCGDSFLV